MAEPQRENILRKLKIKAKEFDEYLDTMLECGIVEFKTVKLKDIP